MENNTSGGFDLRKVVTRDPKTGLVIKENPYRAIAHNGATFYEWPKGSGNLWFGDKSPAGRLDEYGKPILKAPHVEFAPVATVDEKVGIENASLQQENKRLVAEMAAIKKELELTQSQKTEAKVSPKSSNQSTIKTT